MEEVVANYEPAQQSLLAWYYQSLGFQYVVLLGLAAITALAATAVLVLFARGRSTGAAVILFAHLPLLVGLLGFFDGMIRSFLVIAQSPTTPKPVEVATAYGTALAAPLVGLLLTAPSYLLATFGLGLRALIGDRRPPDRLPGK